MMDTFYSLAAFALVALAAWGIGRPLTRRLRIASSDLLEALVWSIALGLVAVGLGLTAWGMIGGLDVGVIRSVTLLAAAYGCLEIVREARCRRANRTQTLSIRAQGVPRSRAMLLIVFCLLTAGGSLVSALAPAVAGDALCYHLELPKVFLMRGAIEYLPLHENSTFPLLAEMWYLWALALDSAVAAQLVHWGLGLLLAAASVLLARPIVGRRGAWLAGGVVLAVPGVTNQMAAPLNDVALATFTTLALVAWQAGRVGCAHPKDANRGKNSSCAADVPARNGNPRDPWWAQPVVPGLMAGAALSVKYVAIVFAAAVGATTCVMLFHDAGRRRLLLRGAGIVSVVAVLVSGVWYARAAYHRGNPVYPFFASVVGAEGPPTVRESKTPLKWSAADLLAAPWQVTMRPDRFGGRGHQLGALFLMLLPVGLVLGHRRLWPLWGISAVYGLLWFALRQNVRFLFPLVPILAVIAAAALVNLRRWPAWPRRIGMASCAAVLGLAVVIPAYRARHHVRVALGRESREDFLARCEPTYQAARFVNANLPPRAHLLSQELRAFYFERPSRARMPSAGRRRIRRNAPTPRSWCHGCAPRGSRTCCWPRPREEPRVTTIP